MNINEFKLDLQAVLEKVKSIANIKRDIKIIESKLPKIKLQGTLNSTSMRKELNTKLKSVNPKVKIDADTTLVEKKIRKLNQQKTNPTITPTIDNSQVVSGLKQAQKETKTLWERFTNGIFGINLIGRGVQEVVQVIRQAIANIKELDAIKTNIQMVSGASDSTINAMMSDYNSMAKDLSSTTKEVAEAANEFLRMGESVASTNELIKSSQVLSKVGMIESAESASYLISSLKGYQIAAENSMDMVSKLTSVDLEAAVSAGGLAEALSKCSNIANNSGVAIDRLIGYTATVGEVTQKSMSEVGNSFQSLLSRMNNIKIGRFIDDETGESLSDTEAVLNKLGIQLRDTENSYRSFDDVLDDIGNRWNDFTKVEQNAISVAIAGTRQRENFESLMNNYGDALKYSETAATSAGSALERYGIYQDSVRAKTNELTAAMESLSTNAISEELFSGIIEATTGVVEFIDEANILKGTLAGIVTMGLSKAFASMATGIIAASKSTAQLTAAMALFDKGRSADNLKDIGVACKGLSDQQLKLVLSTKGLTNVQRQRILVGMGVKDAELQQTLATLGFAEAENIATVSTFSFKGALNSLMTAIMMNPLGALVTAVTAVTIAFSVYKQHQEELIQATQEATNAYKESISSIEDYTKRYQELHKALIEAKGNEEETYNIKKQLLDLQTELNDKFGEEYGKINLVTDAYKDQTEAIKAYNKEIANKTLNDIGEKGINDAKSQMLDKKKYNLGMDVSLYSDEGLAIQELADKYGIDINSSEGSGTFSLILKADATTAESTINDFMADVRSLRDNGDFDFTDSFDNVLDYSGSELKRVKDTIEQLGDALQQILIAEIIKDDDELAKKYNNALETVEALNEAVLKSEDPFNDENVQKLRQDLEALKATFTTEELENYGYVLYDVFDQADTKLIDFHNELKNNSELQKLADNLRGLDNLDLESLNPGENASFDKLKESADEYKLSLAELIDELVRLGYVQTNATEENAIKEPFSAFDGTEIGERLQYINSQFKAGEISCKEYFDALNSEIANVDFSNYTNSLEEANAASAQFFVDSTQQAASGLSDLINKFDSGSMSVSEYLEGYLSIANTLSTLTNELQENSASWNQNGNAMSDTTSNMLDNTQSALDNAISTIQSYQDSIYSLEQLMTGAVEAGTDEFSAHTQVIAEDLANIVATGGQMADEIASTLGTTTAEIASSMSENVSNQSLAAQAITANTNAAIGNMANSVGELFDTLGSAISNFKVDISFGIKSISMQDVDMGLLGTHKLPKIDFSLEASGESLSTIGSAISSFGKSIASNMDSQMIELPDFSFTGEDKYTPDAGVLDNYNKKLNDMKNAQKGAGKATKDTNDALKEQKEALEAEKEALQEQKEAAEDAFQAQIDGIDDVIKGKEKEIDLLDDEIDKIKEAREERKRDIELQKAQYDLERMQNQRPKLVYSEKKGMHYVPDTKGIRDKREKIAELKEDAEIAKLEKKKDLIQDEIDALEEQKDLIRDMIEESNKYYDNLIKQTEKSIKELSKNAEDASKAAGNAASHVGGAINKLRDTLNTGKTLSYYIWTIQDEEVLANAKAGLENLNTLLEKNPENSHYAKLKDDVTNFVNELEKLKETRLVTDDFTNSLNTLKNSEDEYLKLFQDALTGVEERVNNTANYSEQILGFVSPIANKTGELKQILQTANEEVRNLGTNTSDVVNGISTSVNGTNENINRLTGTVADAVMKVNSDSELLDGSVTNLSNTVTRVTESTSTGLNNLAADMSNATSGISQNVDTVNTALNTMSDSERFDNLTSSFNNLGEAILGVSTALGISEEGTVGGLVSAITAINEISLGGEEGGIIGQFHNLKAAIDEVSAAIAGGGGSEGSGSKGGGNSSGSSGKGGNKGTGSNSGTGASSVTGSLEQLLQTADKTLGSGDESGSSDDGETVIGKFGILKNAVNAVVEAIGFEEGAEGDENLISALMAEFNTANEVLPEEQTLFNNLESSIQACVGALRDMIDALNEINSIGMPGAGGGVSTGPAHAKGTVGNAFATGTGYRGLPEAEKNALRSENGQLELTLYPDGTTEITNKPIMSDLPKGTIIFNEDQTKQILNGKPYMRGKINEHGVAKFENNVVVRPNGDVLHPLPEDHPIIQAQKKFEAMMKMGGIEAVTKPVTDSIMREHNKEVDKFISQLNAGNVITNNKNVQPNINVGDIHVTCPGVTSQEVMRHLGGALDEKFRGLHTYADQMSRIR